MDNLNFLDAIYLENLFLKTAIDDDIKTETILKSLKHIEIEDTSINIAKSSISDINLVDTISKIDLTTPSSLSIVYIIKNEAQYIQSTLEKSIACADEIIILDTGSTDDTIGKIKCLHSSKIKIYSKQWTDNFSSARNYANQHATCDWVLTLDADELINFDIDIFRSLLNYLNYFPILKDYVFQLKLVGKKKSFFAGRLIKNTNTFFIRGTYTKHIHTK